MRAREARQSVSPPVLAPEPERDHRRAVKAALLLTLIVLVLEVGGGLASGSLALIADAGHVFADVAALLLAWAGMTLAGRAPTRRHTFGFGRAEVLAAFVNAQILILGSLFILWESVRRFRQPAPIQTSLMLVIAGIGLLANLVAMRLLRGARRGNINLRAAYLEVAADALASIVVIAGAIVMNRTGWYRLDSLLSAGIALVILPRGVAILREAAHILLEGAPEGVDLGALRGELLGVGGVAEVHDLHFWTLTSGLHSASVHIRVSPQCVRDDVLHGVSRVLRESAGVDHATVQVEEGDEAACGSEPKHA